MNAVRFLYGCVAAGVGVTVGVVIGRASTNGTVRRLRDRLADVEYRASHDPLTGLLNRSGLRDHFTGVRRARLVVLIDLDGFKTVNDRCGHAAGDVVLAGFAARLNSVAARHDGIAGRLGGDEFVVLFDLDSPDGTGPTGVVIAQVCSPLSTPGEDGVLGLTASAGITTAGAALCWSDALRQADIALYHAKTTAPRVAHYTPGMAHPAHQAPSER
jgi:diguanylate cyclase (GGDEF)-like protein